MAPDPQDGLPIVQLPDQEAWERWLDEHHGSAPGAWLKTAKKGTPERTVSHPEALESALCFGWIDGQRVGYDERFFLQRFTPRRPRSRWSQINRDKAEQLIKQNRMRPAGHAQVEAAKQDGRWEAAYEPQSRATVPADFQAALKADPQAEAFFATLKGQNRYSFLYRIQDARTPQTRQRRIETFVAMLSRGETFYP